MAEDNSQEKTEEATPKRKQKAREEGQVPRSREFTTTAVLLAGTLGLWVFGGRMSETLRNIYVKCFDLSREVLFDPQFMLSYLGVAFFDALIMLIPLFAVLIIAAILGPIALGGFLFSAKSIQPKLSRIDPLAGLKRMFSVKSLIELVKAIAKVSVVILVSFLVLNLMADKILNLSQLPVEKALKESLILSAIAAVLISASTIVISIIDIPFQIYDHAKKLKMSKQDVKDELKDSDGKPEVKGRIRQLQREMAQRRMMAEVPEADVVITNPTHYSVALKYNPETMETPILVAKGVDHLALKIREIAKEHKIDFVESPVLARAVYHTTDVDETIPGGLYVAVAQVLAYVFQLRNYRRGNGARPEYPRNINVPPDMYFE